MSGDVRKQILDLAVAAVDSGGEAAIRVNDIAVAAGVTPPALYHHFGSREGLVTAAQVERYSRQVFDDIVRIGAQVAACTSKDELRATLVETWTDLITRRATSRWVRMSVLGSAYARPELEAAIAQTQDEIIAELRKILEPCRERGWLRPGIDIDTALVWQHGVLISRVFIERGQTAVDPAEWDRLTLEALVRVFFGD